MESNPPKISVLMPAYNAEKYIAEAIESILNQTHNDFELIIIDDCSTDKTWHLIQKYAGKDQRIIAIKNSENLRIAHTLNKGLHLARGKYIVRMDADDWSYSYRLQKQLDYMENHPEVGMSGGTMEICDINLVKKGYRRYNLSDTEIRKKIFRYSPFCHPSVIFRANIIKDNDLRYSPTLVTAEDYDLYFRVGCLCKFGNLNDVLIKYRVVNTGTSISKERIQESLTLYIRIKAAIEHNYKMSPADKIYLVCQWISTFLIPPNVKIKLFNFLRNVKK